MASQEGQQIDTLPVQIYGWDGKPTRIGVDMFNPGFSIPEYDEVDVDNQVKPTSVTFKLSGVTVASLAITYSGTGINIVRS